MERFQFPFMSHCPWAQLGFWPQLCLCGTLRDLFPTRARGSKSNRRLGHTHSLRPEWSKAATAGVRAEESGACSLWCKSLPMPVEGAHHLHPTQHWCLNSPHSHLLWRIHTASSGPLPISNLLAPCFSTEPLPALNSLYFSSHYTSELHFYWLLLMYPEMSWYLKSGPWIWRSLLTSEPFRNA